MAQGKITLSALFGNYPNTLALKRGEVRSELVDFAFSDIKVANQGFKPLVREHRFDLSELAIVTFLQAKAYGKPYVLMPAPILARGQHQTLAYNAEHGVVTPKGLEGKRVGMRAYTVTTAVWVRGILAEQFGVDLSKVHWVTFEDPHLSEYTDPAWVERAPSGKDMVQMLLDGELDAAVVGDKMPDPRLKSVIADAAATQDWAKTHGSPINHLAVIRSEISRTRPDVVREVYRLIKESAESAAQQGETTNLPSLFGFESNRRALETIIDICYRQELIPERYAPESLFDDVTRTL